ncbi:MAG: NAD(P)/FAD-dependent oxidoreductase [Acidimicrobiia bacterium]|nr:NAD(P)/FAD-dependent oxidoreductase [Actinomycetota bacterium]NDA77575.1 NAD(P)/FAD-dependent oxidoreductase [Actinomycetota bacterium]NDB05323.1 NAD(P)/FAD-dependent oxidoreductase [Acidimicrobiia bacterium]NDE58579.1 NAD(P)/FAD-dependent oxidoreductase [Acidimicrobiia bacterium]NDH46841.1 NAD(P)/FAD-dependent oxidoreductase [Acidimicrobiia bacterium]
MTTTFDPDGLREKYRLERDKRLREDGNEQYIDISEYAQYLDDPYTRPATREPLVDEVTVAIIGGGFGGLLAGARLREAGIEDLRVIEKGGDFGGTWYWNRYPGAACDVESYIYLPLLEEIGYIPKKKYTDAPEILAHSRAIGEHFRLYDNACFSTEVTGMVWEESSRRWIISTNRGDRMRARFVIMANGPLHRPKLPGIRGIESFRGHTFHTSRWDYDYTGGDSTGGLSKLADKRVGIIGTGATAVQCVPHLGASAKELYVFQRTPSSIDVRNNRPTDPEWAASLTPGWQRERMDNFNTLVSGGYAEVDLVNDGWTDIIANLLIRLRSQEKVDLSPESLARNMELADFEKMEQIRSRVDQLVTDPSTASALKPWYRQFCKRPCFHDEYLDTFNRPNVHLIDTDGQGVQLITEKGVVVNGVEYELDCLIYATGFEVGTEYTRRSGYELHGVEGETLTQHWADGTRTLHGFHSRGFPNCFIVSQTQSGFTVNFPHMLNEQSIHLAHLIAHLEQNGLTRVEVTAQAEEEWVRTIVNLAQNNIKFLEACTPGYYNNEGKPAARSLQSGSYGGGPVAFVKVLERWREQGELEGLEVS